MGSVTNILAPTRFLTLLGHFIACILAFYTKHDNIVSALDADYSENDYNSASYEMDAVLYLTVVCFIFEFVSLFMGFSLFMPVLNTTYIFSHFTGGVLLCWFIIDVWHYQTLWVLWIFFSVLPTMLEFGVVGMRICPCCKTNEY